MVKWKTVTGESIEVSQGKVLHFVLFDVKLKGRALESYPLIYSFQRFYWMLYRHRS